MIRVVLDTNIVVSAMLRSGGSPDAIFNLGVDRVIQLCISKPVMAEYEEVLRRPRLDIHPDKIATARINSGMPWSLGNCESANPAVQPLDDGERQARPLSAEKLARKDKRATRGGSVDGVPLSLKKRRVAP